ncbi:MAG TPA: hypothetical protein VNF73_00655 [Candidatus Saccharimonadales bacterium]|nr:hypothetical protein [Candidatus Saccharimonadales bacterium]
MTDTLDGLPQPEASDGARGARVLAIIGSGETAPPLVALHRALLARLGAGAGAQPVPAVLIDTPYGFQDNADDISARTIDYFDRTVGNPIDVASLRLRGADPLTRATAAARLASARYVFSGPGSPSHALRVWTGTEIPDLVAAKLRNGGVVAFASAAALTLGAFTAPIYEIYKVGEDPHWLPGLDLLSSAAGMRVAVVPHYDNAEGGNHDTRFCYLGERRLAAMEMQLPRDAFVLGVDSHTALLLDLAAETATVWGRGRVTVRWHGRGTVFPPGSSIPIGLLRAAGAARAGRRAAGLCEQNASGLQGGRRAGHARTGTTEPSEAPPAPAPATATATVASDSLIDEVARLQRMVAAALDDQDGRAAADALLALDEAILAWSMDTGSTEAVAEARVVQRSVIARLGELAGSGPRISRSTVGPFVDALLDLRLQARARGDWPASDAIRDRLVAAGIEVRDGPEATTWELAAK